MKHSEFKRDPRNNDQLELDVGREMRPANWIVSYPRSGNTFVRSLLANYFSGFDRPLRLDEIVESTRGEHDELLLKELTGKAPVDRSLDEEWCARLPYFERLRNITNITMPLIKSHTPLVGLFERPAFAFTPEDRIIHIVRHPCDVAISYSHFNKINLERAINFILMEGLYLNGHPDRGYEIMGSWAQHTRSWMQAITIPVHRVRYADLIHDSVGRLMNMVAFLNVVPRRDRAERAVEFSDLDRLRSEEKEKGFSEGSKNATEPFFREGRPDQWLDVLSVNQARRILNADMELIDHFGFKKLAIA